MTPKRFKWASWCVQHGPKMASKTVVVLGQNTFWRKMITTWTLTCNTALQRPKLASNGLVGHWWERKCSKRETRRPWWRGRRQANLRQTIQTYDSQATGESVSKQNLGLKVTSWKWHSHSPNIAQDGQTWPQHRPQMGQHSPNKTSKWANIDPFSEP